MRDLLLFAGAGLFLSQFSYLMAIQVTNSATATVLQSLQLLPVAAVACVIGVVFSPTDLLGFAMIIIMMPLVA